MAKTSEKAPVDDIDHLKKVAFWYWEYMRRNSQYRKYCEIIQNYIAYFSSLGVFEYMQTKEYLDEMAEYVYSHESRHDLKYTPFRVRLDRDHGEKAGKMFFRYGFLANGFENKFGRIYKCCSCGINSYEAIDDILNGKPLSFFTDDISDIAAMTKLNGKWLVSIDDDVPCNFYYAMDKVKEVKIDPISVVNSPDKVGLEAHAISLINKAVAGLFEKQNLSSETLQSVYKLSLSGKHINSTDVMRLAMLWIWDKAHEDDKERPKAFDDIYPLLKTKVEKAGATDSAWDQVVNRRKRIAGYYEMTEYCIENVTVTSLNQK